MQLESSGAWDPGGPPLNRPPPLPEVAVLALKVQLLTGNWVSSLLMCIAPPLAPAVLPLKTQLTSTGALKSSLMAPPLFVAELPRNLQLTT